MTAITNEANEVVGIFTEGDLRRLIEKSRRYPSNLYRLRDDEASVNNNRRCFWQWKPPKSLKQLCAISFWW